MDLLEVVFLGEDVDALAKEGVVDVGNHVRAPVELLAHEHRPGLLVAVLQV